MNVELSAQARMPALAQTTATARFFRNRLLATLAELDGSLTLIDSDGEHCVGSGPTAAVVRLTDPVAWQRIALGGSVGAGAAYIDGQWSTEDLVGLVRFFVRNRDRLDAMESGLARVGHAVFNWSHGRRRNHRAGSRRNIEAHYDLGNDFFATFLDDSLMYSSAIYARADEPLALAQTRKLERICKMLDLKASDRVIEIGTGWGGFAVYAARHYGCHVTTTTISPAQVAHARARVEAAGLADRVSVLDQDYRELTGQFDHLVSIEMIEAVGHQYLDTYLQTCCRLLKDDGSAMIQAITVEESRYKSARGSVDFIKRFVFPGSFIPALAPILDAVSRVTDFSVADIIDIGPSYALTLAEWRRRFNGAADDIAALGFDEKFQRLWNFYLAYCEGGYREGALGDHQILLERPGSRRARLAALEAAS